MVLLTILPSPVTPATNEFDNAMAIVPVESPLTVSRLLPPPEERPSLSDIDDEELDDCMLTQEEKAVKSRLWHEVCLHRSKTFFELVSA